MAFGAELVARRNNDEARRAAVGADDFAKICGRYQRDVSRNCQHCSPLVGQPLGGRYHRTRMTISGTFGPNTRAPPVCQLSGVGVQRHNNDSAQFPHGRDRLEHILKHGQGTLPTRFGRKQLR